MSSHTFDKTTIRTLATDNSYYRGEQYLRMGKVRNLVIDDNTYRAHVHGTHRYVVEIWGDGEQLACTCTCPYDWGGICKHIVAVMLSILQREESDQQIEHITTAKPQASIPLDELLTSLSAEKLRSFVRVQAAEFPQLAENLQIFSAGASETDKTVEDYQGEITSALQNANLTDPHEYEHYHYEYDDEFDEENQGDTVESLLDTFVASARKYHTQGNWIENAKIQEAIVRACGQIATAGRDKEGVDYEEEENEEENDNDDYEVYDDTGFVEDASYTEAHRALSRWAEALADAKPAKDKRRMLERLAALFAENPYGFAPETWEKVCTQAVCNKTEALHVLTTLKKGVPRLDQHQEKAGVLLHLLDLSGESERFVKVGRTAVGDYPHLALPLSEKLATIGKKRDAIKIAIDALDRIEESPYAYELYKTQQDLRRFLLRVGDRRRDYKRMVECAKALLFSANQLDDYLLLRDMLRTRKEREALIAKIKEECTGAALIDIFSAEERWDDLLDAARTHSHDRDFPRMIEALQDRFPTACFDLYKQMLLDLADSGADRRIYQQVADHARQLQKIPDHDEDFAQLMGEVVEKYPRRLGLMEELGELAELGKQWRDRARRARYERATSGAMTNMSIDELMHVCPIGHDDQKKLRGERITWNRSSAALVWAVLTAYGGRMDAADITTAIVEHRHCMPQSAGSQRSTGIRMLEALGYIEVERQGNRLCGVRLIKKGKSAKPQ